VWPCSEKETGQQGALLGVAQARQSRAREHARVCYVQDQEPCAALPRVARKWGGVRTLAARQYLPIRIAEVCMWPCMYHTCLRYFHRHVAGTLQCYVACPSAATLQVPQEARYSYVAGLQPLPVPAQLSHQACVAAHAPTTRPTAKLPSKSSGVPRQPRRRHVTLLTAGRLDVAARPSTALVAGN
jgi:hypothetical protein